MARLIAIACVAALPRVDDPRCVEPAYDASSPRDSTAAAVFDRKMNSAESRRATGRISFILRAERRLFRQDERREREARCEIGEGGNLPSS